MDLISCRVRNQKRMSKSGVGSFNRYPMTKTKTIAKTAKTAKSAKLAKSIKIAKIAKIAKLNYNKLRNRVLGVGCKNINILLDAGSSKYSSAISNKPGCSQLHICENSVVFRLDYLGHSVSCRAWWAMAFGIGGNGIRFA